VFRSALGREDVSAFDSATGISGHAVCGDRYSGGWFSKYWSVVYLSFTCPTFESNQTLILQPGRRRPH
jgi:hypothetical protein